MKQREMTDKEYLAGLAQKIKELRKERGMTQSSLGEKIGTNHTHIVRLEKGIQDCRIISLRAIAKALEVDISELVSVP